MKVSDLAAELEVPASTILDQCQRFGIDAAWAGAELSGADVVVLRSELATTDPIDLTPADPVTPEPAPAAPAAAEPEPAAPVPGPAASEPEAGSVAPDPVPAPAPDTAPAGSALPPTAVGSMPGLIDEVTPEPQPEAATAGPGPRSPGFPMAGATTAADADAVRTVRHREPPSKRRVDRSARTAVLSLVVAVAAFAGSNFVELAALVALLWVIAIVALVVAVYDSIRGRRHAQTHPDRTRGVWLATFTLVLAIAGIVGITATVFTVVNDESPVDAPLGIGDLKSVQTARWGFQRTRRVAGNGWTQPARADGTCWNNEHRDERGEDRVENTEVTEQQNCNVNHTLEVAKVFAMNREADAPYPGPDGFMVAAERECGAIIAKVQKKVPEATLAIEYPTDTGWFDGDHDVACIIETPTRQGKLTG